MPSILDTKQHVKSFVLSEAPNQRSRTNGVVAQTGTAIASGTVMGIVTASGKYVPYSNAASDGSQTAVGILYNFLPAKTGDSNAVIFDMDCEVNRFELTGVDAPAEVELLARGIKVRGKNTPGIATPAL